MTAFRTYNAYRGFASFVKSESRHILGPLQHEFLKGLWDSSEARDLTLAKGTIVYRSQAGCDYTNDGDGNIPVPYLKERMCPRADRATEGRANPKGIPCLYVASNPETAVAEGRPWKGALLSVARFELTFDCRLIDCSRDQEPTPARLRNPTPQGYERKAWHDVNSAFSKPVTRNDDESTYAPTQIIAEYFKSQNAHGVAYSSAVGGGLNYAIFDLGFARFIDCQLYEVKDLRIAAEPLDS